MTAALKRSMDPQETQIRAKLAKDFTCYAPACLQVRPKVGEIKPFKLNQAQLKVHAAAQRQIQERGYCRFLVLKARQLGMSTYIEGRFYWRVTHRQGVRAFILTHHADATANLFSMAKRFYDNSPPAVQPLLGASSSREMAFPGLDSGYKVGTAGTEGVGRSDTIQYFHGSEVAFWHNAETHAAGALQAVPKGPGTEVWLESTANGMGGLFHEMWQDAVRGASDYEPIFLPWYDDPAYRAEVPEDFELSVEDGNYQEFYGLDMEQMAWRHLKIAELRSDWLFRQEYPATATEAFQVSGGDTLIDSQDVMRARRTEVKEPVGGLVIGVDPADGGEDRSAIIRRKGRQAYGIETYTDKKSMELAGIVATIIEVEEPDMVFVDKGGIGAGLVDRLLEMGYGSRVTGVNFGAGAMNQGRYKNLRAEMWGKMAEWIDDHPCDLPDEDSLHQDLCAPRYKWTSSRQIQLESKEDMAGPKRGLRSPDEGDALALTFAYPVRGSHGKPKRDRYQQRTTRPGTWMSV